jgi:hypothetical protein
MMANEEDPFATPNLALVKPSKKSLKKVTKKVDTQGFFH